MDNTEIWAMIPEYPNYEASTHGRIRRTDSGLIKAQHSRGGKYITVALTRNGKNITEYVHRLVLMAHIGPPPVDKPYGCHYPDKDPTNNRLENLRWDSHKANMEDKKYPNGEIHSCTCMCGYPVEVYLDLSKDIQLRLF